MITKELAERMWAVLMEFDNTLEATGGLVTVDDGCFWAPAADPEWIDLGVAGRRAKKVLREIDEENRKAWSAEGREYLWLVVGHDYTTGAEDNIWCEEVRATTKENAMKRAQTDRCAQFECAEEDQKPRFAVSMELRSQQ